MSSDGRTGGIRRRRSVRARIAVGCAGLFLVTGAAFVAVTYILVDHSLHATLPTGVIASRLVRTCEAAKGQGTLKFDPSLYQRCLYVWGETSQRERDLHQLLMDSVAGLAGATVVAGVLGWTMGRRILRPLHLVTAAARKASQERLDERINLGGTDDELKVLADTFDDMLDRLDRAFASQRRFVANASHELRTPLTSMRTLIDVALAKPTRTAEGLEVLVGQVRAALGQSEGIIDGLLTLARSDRGLHSQHPVDLEAAAQDAVDQVSGSARDAQVSIETDLAAGPTLGDRVLLDRLAANLVDNAVRYNIAGGSVRVTTGSQDGTSYMTVANTGPVVPESAVTSLFEPFTRLNERVDNGHGAGLGLSIVASVVKAHRGQLQARALSGGGLEISVRLPKVRVVTWPEAATISPA